MRRLLIMRYDAKKIREGWAHQKMAVLSVEDDEQASEMAMAFAMTVTAASEAAAAATAVSVCVRGASLRLARAFPGSNRSARDGGNGSPVDMSAAA
jgi:hypothetical protein